MKKLLLSLLLVSASGVVYAEDAASPHTVSANVALTSNYIYRGISQTFDRPAIQGGFDYSHSSGFYAGTWGSNISGSEFIDGSMELDLYAGYKKSLNADFTLDVGLLQYMYPGAGAGIVDYETTELYAAGTYKMVTLKYSHTLGDFFGLPDSKGSGYLEANAAFDLGNDFGLILHAGHQAVKNYKPLDYTDFKIGVTKAYKGYTFGAAYSNTNADSALYTYTNLGGKSVEVANGTLIVSVSRSF